MEQAGILIPVICAVLAAMILTYLFANGRRCRTTDSYMLCITLILSEHCGNPVADGG